MISLRSFARWLSDFVLLFLAMAVRSHIQAPKPKAARKAGRKAGEVISFPRSAPSMSPPADLRAVFFDIDGTLIDSNDAHARAWGHALREHGYHVAFEALRCRIGKGGDKILPEVVGVAADSVEGKKISARRREIFLQQYLPQLRPFAGARELLLELRRRGLKLYVASSAEAEERDPLLSAAGVDDLIDVPHRDEDDRSKPDPDIVVAALERSGEAAGSVVLIGDTPFDIEAAARAGIATVAFRCGGWKDEALAGAIAIYEDPLDLLRRIEASPLRMHRRERASATAR